MGFDMLLEVLRAFEGLAAEITLVRLQRNVDPDMRRDVVALDRRRPAVPPLAGEVQIVGALATDMALADVFLAAVSLCRNTLISQ